MKRVATALVFTLILSLLLSSCDYLKFDTCHPTNQPMSKWEGDAEGLHFELYIGEGELEDFMVIDYGNKKIPYLVCWYKSYLTQMTVSDIRESVLNQEMPAYEQNPHLLMSAWNINLINETCFKITNDPTPPSNIKCKIPELSLPKEIIMTRVENGLSEEDFSQIARDEAYDLCPIYRYGTQWVSDDNKVIINLVADTDIKITFAEEPNSAYHIYFSEVDYKAYLIKWEEYSLFYFSDQIFLSATEEWQCEYFENYFRARVIRSEHYEPGHIITFTLVEQSPTPTE